MKRTSFIFLVLILSASLMASGCSSAQKKLSEDVKGMKTRVDTIETRVESVEAKQAETERLAMEQAQRVEELKAGSQRARPSGKTNFEFKEKRSLKDKEHIKEIQSRLKNAGFYQGEIDGVKGRKTRAAIRKFQKENGLYADGIVGRKTWEALSKYASGGAGGAAVGGAEEEATTK